MINKDGTVVVGLKGRSGRKSVSEEIAKREAVVKAWNKINNEIDKENVKDVALPLALKTMVDKKELSGDLGLTINSFRDTAKDKTAE